MTILSPVCAGSPRGQAATLQEGRDHRASLVWTAGPEHCSEEVGPVEYVTPALAVSAQLAGQRPPHTHPNLPGLPADALSPHTLTHPPRLPREGQLRRVGCGGGGGETAARVLRSPARLSHPFLAPNCWLLQHLKQNTILSFLPLSGSHSACLGYF